MTRPSRKPIQRPMSDENRHLKRGWTTGACATAAAKAACAGLLTGVFPDPVEIGLPGGRRVAFALAMSEVGADSATVGIVKDAGDDPDVTHGALVKATVRRGAAGSGITMRADPASTGDAAGPAHPARRASHQSRAAPADRRSGPRSVGWRLRG